MPAAEQQGFGEFRLSNRASTRMPSPTPRETTRLSSSSPYGSTPLRCPDGHSVPRLTRTHLLSEVLHQQEEPELVDRGRLEPEVHVKRLRLFVLRVREHAPDAQ